MRGAVNHRFLSSGASLLFLGPSSKHLPGNNSVEEKELSFDQITRSSFAPGLQRLQLVRHTHKKQKVMLICIPL